MHEVSLRAKTTKSVLLRLTLALTLAAVCTACGANAEPELNYKPDFLPVELSISQSGVSIKGDESLATPIGSFSIGAHYNLLPPNSDGIYVILRNRKVGYDHIFEVRTGGDQFMAVVNGTTSISITNHQVLIDVTNGAIRKISFKRVKQQIQEQGSNNWFISVWHSINSRWDTGYSQSWYKPYALTRWAYSDSTIGKWFGIGFAWFLFRLIFAIIMFLVDTVLSLGFLLGQAGFMLFGPTGRDAVYGLIILAVIAIAIAGGMSA